MSVPAKRYEGAEPYIFISYSHADSGRVLSIVAAMQKRGYRVWWDENITAGEQWTAALANEIADCEIFMPFISRTFADSKYCMQEVRHAKGEKRNIVPVKLDLNREQYPKELKFLLENAQGFSADSFPTSEAFAARLDAEPLFQRCCRSVDTNSSAPLAKVVTRNRPAAPSGAFVGRQDVMQAIGDAFRDGEQAVILYGMGGIGKSEICRKLFREYAHDAGTRLAGHIGWTTWRGTLSETFYGQFLDIVDKNAEIHWQKARDYIRTLGADLLMFLDNADNLTETNAASLTELGGRFLITSRKRTGRLFSISAGTLAPEQCRVLYRRALYEDDACTDNAPDTELDEILRLAGYHTLSVELLGKTQLNAGMSTAQMLAQLKESGFDLSGADITYLHNPEQATGNADEEGAFIEHMSRVFDLSQLHNDADALRALQGMSLLAPNTPIPLQTAQKWLGLDTPNGLNRAVKAGWLNRSMESGATAVSIHPVIAAVVRCKAMPDETLIETVVRQLSQDMIPGTIEVFTIKLPILEHTKELYRIMRSMNLQTRDYARMFHQMGYLIYLQGDYANALEWYQRALCIRESVLDINHPDTAATYHNIGKIYYSQGYYFNALKWYQKALRIRENVLGKDSPDTATTYNDIALLYDTQGDYSNALEWYQKALRIRERVLGTDHPDTAASYGNIGRIYYSQGNYDSALEWYMRDLHISENVLGTNHPGTAIPYHNIAGVYAHRRDYASALEWYQKALRIRESILIDHPYTAITYHNIGMAYFEQCDYREALKWLEKALAVRLKVLGAEHPDTKSTQEWIDKTKRQLSSEK